MTTPEIQKMLRAYRKDQVNVIHEMAATRGLDPEKLTPRQYQDLLEEEASFSVKAAAPQDKPTERRYARALRAMAARI